MFNKMLPLSEVSLKFKMEDERTFTGYASTFNNVDAYNDTILPGAYKNAVKTGAQKLKMFFNHKSWEFPVGKWTSISEDNHGLLLEGELTKGNTLSENLYASMKHGTIDGLSIGFRLDKKDFEESEGKRIIKNVTELVEVSPVIFPADELARIDLTSVKNTLGSIKNMKELESFLRDEGNFSIAVSKTFLSRAKSIFLRDVDEEEKQTFISAFANILQEQKSVINSIKG